MLEVMYLSMVVACISFTVTETQLFQAIRESSYSKSYFLGKVLSCGYCFGHWISFILTTIYTPRLLELWWPLDYFMTSLVIAWLAGIQWVLMCLIMEKSGK
jgi:hypothetical protein